MWAMALAKVLTLTADMPDGILIKPDFTKVFTAFVRFVALRSN